MRQKAEEQACRYMYHSISEPLLDIGTLTRMPSHVVLPLHDVALDDPARKVSSACAKVDSYIIKKTHFLRLQTIENGTKYL